MSVRTALLIAAMVMGVLGMQARAVEIPIGVTANCFQGTFGNNRFVKLEEATVPTWPEVRMRREINLATVTLAFQKNDDPATAEQIAVVYAVTDRTGDVLISPPMKEILDASGTVRLPWDLRTVNGDRVEDGLYRVKMHIYGRNHGHLLTDALFPLYIATEAPVLSEPKLSKESAVLEYGGAPVVGFTLNTAATVVISELDDRGVEIDRTESVFGKGPQSARPDLRDRNDELFKPGNHRVRVTAKNDFGESETFLYRYVLDQPPPLEVAVSVDRLSKLQARDDTITPFTVHINQPAYLAVEHVDETGASDYIAKSTPARPAVLFNKGSHKMVWRRLNREENVRYTDGTHYIRVTAGNMVGEEETAETEPIKLDAGPASMRQRSRSDQPMVAQLSRRRRPSVSVAVEPSIVPISEDMTTRVSYVINRPAHVTLTLYSGDKPLRTLVDSRTEEKDMLPPDVYTYHLDASKLNPGSYRVVLAVDAEEFKETVTDADLLTVVWRD